MNRPLAKALEPSLRLEPRTFVRTFASAGYLNRYAKKLKGTLPFNAKEIGVASTFSRFVSRK